MSKDHAPGDFARKNGYRSDLEIAESGPMVKSVNTSFGSKNHNAYVHRTDGTHEHFFYSPKDARSGWHGHNWETRNNHPQSPVKESTNTSTTGGKTMERNSFIESLRTDKATIDRCNRVSKTVAEKSQMATGKRVGDDGGRERGDTGPASLGREAGNKCGPSNARSASGEGHGGQSAQGHGTSGHGGANGGQGAGGQGGPGGGHGGH